MSEMLPIEKRCNPTSEIGWRAKVSGSLLFLKEIELFIWDFHFETNLQGLNIYCWLLKVVYEFFLHLNHLNYMLSQMPAQCNRCFWHVTGCAPVCFLFVATENLPSRSKCRAHHKIKWDAMPSDTVSRVL